MPLFIIHAEYILTQLLENKMYENTRCHMFLPKTCSNKKNIVFIIFECSRNNVMHMNGICNLNSNQLTLN